MLRIRDQTQSALEHGLNSENLKLKLNPTISGNPLAHPFRE